LHEFINKQNLPAPGSNRGYLPITILLGFFVSIWTGGNRFAHCQWLRYDKVLGDIFGWKEAPTESAYSRFFKKFTLERNNEVFPSIMNWMFEKIALPNVTLDLDSTILERYGKQEGSKKGYNPKKPGRPSHHPLIALSVKSGWQ